LIGGDGNDNLYAGVGTDTLEGGMGNDIYYLSYVAADGTTNDTIIEAVGEGIDLAYSFLNVTAPLADNVENLTLIGTTATIATGNTQGNTITGNSANNVIDGGVGSDTLYGGAGNDVFVFDSTSFLNQVITGGQLSGVDKIGDFTVNQDKIQLSKLAFAAISNTMIAANNTLSTSGFTTVANDAAAAASTTAAAIIYSSGTGNLFYNTNAIAGFGTDGGRFAQLNAGLTSLTGSDFTVVA
jgi:Ca2+-binding RTX toxin-like protein